MTDKQIIIDGVDVHWCEHYTGNIGYLTDKNWTCRAKIQGTKCEDWSDCYFKRWQRKEKECEELKSLLKVRIEDLCDSCGASSMKLMPCKVYEKTLTEIKEIATHCINQDICTFCDYSDKCYIEDEEIPTYDVCKLILQKISECEVLDE